MFYKLKIVVTQADLLLAGLPWRGSITIKTHPKEEQSACSAAVSRPFAAKRHKQYERVETNNAPRIIQQFSPVSEKRVPTFGQFLPFSWITTGFSVVQEG
jgi:hypothetical protein